MLSLVNNGIFNGAPLEMVPLPTAVDTLSPIQQTERWVPAITLQAALYHSSMNTPHPPACGISHCCYYPTNPSLLPTPSPKRAHLLHLQIVLYPLIRWVFTLSRVMILCRSHVSCGLSATFDGLVRGKKPDLGQVVPSLSVPRHFIFPN